MQQHSAGLSPRHCTHQASASSQALSQQYGRDHGASSVCRGTHAKAHTSASLQPTARPSAAPAGLYAQASQANTVLTPLNGACAKAQQTYTRHRQNDSSVGRQAKRSRTADYAWLQGADDNTPATASQHVRQGLLWWNDEAGQSDEVQFSFQGCNAAAAVSRMASQSHQDTLAR